ncbi:(d)CMP kinase [Phreatobacter oligotrophus]|jgi:cytidylate kinase|uniref:Cytidylate kinase n=1 Tax=Phreatobacter oligotrophus TaxID=1122261 RepID=A0A2T4YY69_9HYPH|nr:(d)CMP kinase [Phreatobacter oligotrophus]PTM51452.1 cytidylate kinase [Phreatobacter oligotrophus]
MIIAIDGPAASGKGTIARRLAAHFGLPHLDTGLLYRGVGRIMLDRGFPLDNVEIATAIAENLDIADLAGEALRTREAGEAASVVAAHAPVRQALLDLQRAFAAQTGGAVLDGRDIGTVIAPDAPAKLFVTASPEERARRRFRELVGRGELADEEAFYAAVLADIAKRDARDSGRSSAPLIIAPDALVLDTTTLGIEEAFAAALAAVESARR